MTNAVRYVGMQVLLFLCPHEGESKTEMFEGACLPVICILVGKLRKLLV